MKNIKGLGNILLALLLPALLFETATLIHSLIVWDITGSHTAAWTSDLAMVVPGIGLFFGFLVYARENYRPRIYALLPLLFLAVISCKKEEPVPPSNPTPRSLSSYESSIHGDWILKRQDLYDANGVTYYTIDYPDSLPANSKTHYKFTDMESTACTTVDQWRSFSGTPTNEVQSCWRAVTDTITMASYNYYVEFLASDSLIFKMTEPGAGYRLYFKR